MMNFGAFFFIICWWIGVKVVAATSRDHQLEYVPLRRTEIVVPDVSTVADVCSSLCRDVSHIWVNRRKIRKDIRRNAKRWAKDIDGGSSSSPFGLVRRNNKTNNLLHRTASVATQVAAAALRVSPPEDSCNTVEDCTKAEFEAFNDLSRISTTLVSHNFSENSVLLAKLKTMKLRGNKQPVPAVSEEENVSTEETNGVGESALQCLTDPLIPQSVWDRLTGREFPQHMNLLDGLAKTGYRLASNDDSDEWVVWNKVASSFKESLDDGAIRVWTGHAVVGDETKYYGASAPFIKTRSIIPMTPAELIELMLDSSRVQSYNKWSVGRIDLWKSPDEQTKIAQNTNQVPMGKKPLRSTTLLHACPIGKTDAPVDETTSWLLLSRAIGPQPVDESIGTSDILLGVNLVQPCGDGQSSILTAITHVYSTAVPGMLAERLGVSSAIKFVKDLRALVVPVSS